MPTDTTTLTALFSGTSLIVAFFGGMVMLFAPCCITLMLPAYLGSVFKAKSLVFLMTLVFATGVASVMLPIVLGARFLVSFFNNYHFFVFAGGSLLMIGIGLMSLFGKTIELPFASRLQSPRITNAASAYTLGIVSGISSSCCAPVLLGALTLAALSPTILQAAAVGFAYTFGIVFPLFLLSFFFEKGWWKWGIKLQQKVVTLGKLRVALANFIAFVIFTLTGLIFLILAMTDKIQMNEKVLEIAVNFRSRIDTITKPIRSLPYSEYIFGIILAGILIYFIKLAFVNKNRLEKKEDSPKVPQI